MRPASYARWDWLDTLAGSHARRRGPRCAPALRAALSGLSGHSVLGSVRAGREGESFISPDVQRTARGSDSVLVVWPHAKDLGQLHASWQALPHLPLSRPLRHRSVP